jgi:hypothetical protein
MAVGCSHGILADKISLANVVSFATKWKPDTAIHLGDFCDLAAFRAGAKGTADEAISPQDDFNAGCEFLEQYFEASGATKRIIHEGNHEDRVHTLAANPNAVIAFAAQQGVNAIRDVSKRLKAELVEYDNITGWRQFGDTIFGHGYMCNETFIRDHAETFGKCCIAHGHKVGQATGRRSDNPTAYCVGTLANIPAMGYAKLKRSRLAWSQGLNYFEYCDDETVLWLVEGPRGETTFDANGVPHFTRSGHWRFPI